MHLLTIFFFKKIFLLTSEVDTPDQTSSHPDLEEVRPREAGLCPHGPDLLRVLCGTKENRFNEAGVKSLTT